MIMRLDLDFVNPLANLNKEDREKMLAELRKEAKDLRVHLPKGHEFESHLKFDDGLHPVYKGGADVF